MKKNILLFTLLSTSLMGCPKSGSETSVQSNPSSEASSAENSAEPASEEFVCELNLKVIKIESMDKIFDDAKALDAKICNLVDALKSANALFANLGDTESVTTEVSGLISSGAVKITLDGGAPDLSFDEEKLEGRSKEIADSLDALIGSIKQAKTDIPTLQTDLEGIIASSQEALGSLPTELKDAASSGTIKPTEIPKLLKAAKGNIGELGNIKSHITMLKDDVELSMTTISSLGK